MAEDWQNVVQFTKDHGVISREASAPLDKLYTNKFVDDFNKFDRDAVTKQARALDPKTIK